MGGGGRWWSLPALAGGRAGVVALCGEAQGSGACGCPNTMTTG